MDNLTHALTGAAIAKAGADRITPLATATLVIAANVPDIDVLSYVRGEYFALSFRRGITHGWPALLLLPVVVTVVMLAWDRWVRRRRNPEAEPARARAILGLSFVGILTHPTLDWMNTYGLRWGLPFNGSWSYADALFIVDPWIWLVLGGAVFLAVWPARAGTAAWMGLSALASALVFSQARGAARAIWLLGLAGIAMGRLMLAPPRPGGRTAGARLALAGTAAYIATLMFFGGVARRQVVGHAASLGLDVRDVMVAPIPVNPFVSEVEIQTADAFVPGVHRWIGTPRVELRPEESVPLRGGSAGVSTADIERVAAAARTVPEVRSYLVWSRHPYVWVESAPSGWTVTYRDARYDRQPGVGGLGGVTVRLGPDLRPID